jgi:hypothetical protein
MMKIIYIILFCMTLFWSCVKEGPVGPQGQNGTNANSDKQIRFSIGAIYSYGDTLSANLSNSDCGLQQFSVANYPGVDSAVLMIYDIQTYASCCGGPNIVYETSFELYNTQTGLAIPGSRIVSDDTPLSGFAVSGNIVNRFPAATCDLGVRVIADHGIYSTTGRIYLMLYRK